MAISKANLANLKKYMDTLQEFEELEERMKLVKKRVYDTLSICFESETVPDNAELVALQQAIAEVNLANDSVLDMLVHLEWVGEYKQLVSAGTPPQDAAKHVREQVKIARSQGTPFPVRPNTER